MKLGEIAARLELPLEAPGDVEPGAPVLGTPHMERRRWVRAIVASERLPERVRRVRRREAHLGVKPED